MEPVLRRVEVVAALCLAHEDTGIIAARDHRLANDITEKPLLQDVAVCIDLYIDRLHPLRCIDVQDQTALARIHAVVEPAGVEARFVILSE